MSIRAASRLFATAASSNHHKVLVVGAGPAGLSVANMLYNKFADSGKTLADGDIALIDGSEWHNYQPGWTLVGAGLKKKEDLRRTVASLVPSHLTLHPQHASTFSPSTNSVTLSSGSTLTYDYLVMCPGLQINFGAIKGLEEALKAGTRQSQVGTIYSYDGCDQVWDAVNGFQGKKAIFTQPKGIIKCAGAPQKAMWMSRHKWAQQDKKVDVEFVSGMPSMFSVPKYSKALAALAEERNVKTSLDHDLVSLSHTDRKATFKTGAGETVVKDFDFLHVVPPQGPLDIVKNSPISDASGYVPVSASTLQHTEFPNVFAIGDASSLPTSKTAAAVTGQTPVLVHNLHQLMESGRVGHAAYDGYTSCPLLTGYGELMLAEFKYGLVPQETFAKFGFDQAKPNRAFYHLTKDLFPFVYFEFMTKGRWYGKDAIFPPKF
ncbi:FAD/NAD-P-binding domain-containing protein [Mrakia frigida]|uniref:FAD/NAD-P-binding domain-containing protein n=1 Tax=Mrakia frigida TaxID=29902 RepID=UPI003FCC26C3